jgi:hypothetical protein
MIHLLLPDFPLVARVATNSPIGHKLPRNVQKSSRILL